ncbi:MAG: isoprenyl transferase [Bacteroidetes bacterium]|nr:isoprenyl transferase [Bacteroidota bacterium]
MEIPSNIDTARLPQHIAIIMDGNGRWAQQRSKPRIFGHKNAVTAVRETVEAAARLGIKYLTLYAFSTENWNRPKSEIDELMELLVDAISRELDSLKKNNIRLVTIGDLGALPGKCAAKIMEAVKITRNNSHMALVVALSYSSRWEIVEAAKKISKEIESGSIKVSDINESLFTKYLATSGIPDPELLIRTSGEYRISNYLLWQIAYTELWFTPVLWPDFRKEHLFNAITEYQARERRFGKTSEQIRNK